ncbi:hypothetical protein [Halobaculum limi]|uniref:hypothetical protein n=1 Tax=Halobaculum limi TaxID=3031916 RepID=UPI00240769BC|nr:hypothetical protein [Halobaculum sp. YSMS11]
MSDDPSGRTGESNGASDAAVDPEYDPEMRTRGHPIDSNALLIAAAKASVGPGRLPELLRETDEYLRAHVDEYDRRYECVDRDEDTGTATYLVPDGHWDEIGADLSLDRRECDALRRAHEQHLLRVGTQRRRRREFESALELRDAVVVSG